MELTAIGDRVFAAEAILKRRVRKVRKPRASFFFRVGARCFKKKKAGGREREPKRLAPNSDTEKSPFNERGRDGGREGGLVWQIFPSLTRSNENSNEL